MSVTCAYCATALPLSLSVTTVRCPRCGAVHHSDGDVISPRMCAGYHSIVFNAARVPSFQVPRASPWMDARYVPLDAGHYDTRFRDGSELVLWWDATRGWCTWDMQRVNTRQLLSWRGAWA